MITTQDLAIFNIESNAGKTPAQILDGLIKEDMASAEKKEMAEGVAYFDAENPTISDRKQYSYDGNGNRVEQKDENLVPNHKLIHSFSFVQIVQKSGYIANNSITVTSTIEGQDDYLESLKAVTGREFDDKFIDVIEDSAKRGYQAFKILIDAPNDDNPKGVFQYVPIDGDELILAYDQRHGQTLEQVIRYYYIMVNDEKLIRAEWWVGDEVTFFQQTPGGGGFEQEGEAVPGIQGELEREGETIAVTEDNSWGRVPFVIFKNNADCIPDHRYIKSLIDNYDMTTSDFTNNLDKLDDTIIEVSGYRGDDAAEARQNIKQFKVILTEAGDRGQGVHAIEVTIPYEAKDAHLNRLEKDINTFGMAVNHQRDTTGEKSGEALKHEYALLNLKAGRTIRKATDALYDFFWFCTFWINLTEGKEYDSETLKITFNLDMIANDSQTIQNLAMSTDLSLKTRLENHPMVENVEDELERLESEPKVEIPLEDEE